MLKRSLKDPPPEEQPFPVHGYVIINGLFYGFCILVFVASFFLSKGEVTGLVPVLVGLCLLFTIVTVYDAWFDRYVYQKRLKHLQAAHKEKEETLTTEIEGRGLEFSGDRRSTDSQRDSRKANGSTT